MMDLIDRAAVKAGMMKYGFTAPNMTVHEFVEDELPTIEAVPLEKLCEWLSEWMANMRELVSKQPTVDAVPVKHGHWEDAGSLSCRCSECGCKNDRETRFCPNCGAKIDLEDEQ